MAQTTTLAQLKVRALEQADLTNSLFVASARLTEWINDALGELHDIIVTSYEDYIRSTATITLVSGTQSYDLPADLYKLLKVWMLSGNDRYIMRRANIEDFEVKYERRMMPSVLGPQLLYAIMGTKFLLDRAPSSSGSVELWYVPQFVPITDEAGVIHASIQPGWEAFVIYDVAARCLVKEESDPAAVLALRDAVRKRIVDSAPSRDAGEPRHVTDVYSRRLSSFGRYA